MCVNFQSDLVTFTEYLHNGKLHLVCAVFKPIGKIIINFKSIFENSPVKYFVKKPLTILVKNPCKIQEKTSGVLLVIICNSFKPATFLNKTPSQARTLILYSLMIFQKQSLRVS